MTVNDIRGMCVPKVGYKIGLWDSKTSGISMFCAHISQRIQDPENKNEDYYIMVGVLVESTTEKLLTKLKPYVQEK